MELVASNFNEHREIYDRFWKRFGTERTRKSIYAKCEDLRDRGPSRARKAQLWSSDEDRFIKEWPGRPRDLLAAFPKILGSVEPMQPCVQGIIKCRKESETRREDDQRHSIDNVGRDHRQLVSNCMNMFL